MVLIFDRAVAGDAADTNQAFTDSSSRSQQPADFHAQCSFSELAVIDLVQCQQI